MRTELGGGVKLPDGRTRAALLALMAFATIVLLAASMIWTIAGHSYPTALFLRSTMPGDAGTEPAAIWRNVATRHGGFDVDAPRWRPLGLETSHLRRTDGLARELFQFGAVMDDRRHAALVVDRGEISSGGPATDIEAIAADLGVAAELVATPLPLATKFGPMDTADMTIATTNGPKACLAFLLRAEDAALRIGGWVCNGGPEIVSRQEATCFIDRLFAVGVRDAAVGSLFARAELARQPCPAHAAGGTSAEVISERNGRPSPLRFTRL